MRCVVGVCGIAQTISAVDESATFAQAESSSEDLHINIVSHSDDEMQSFAMEVDAVRAETGDHFTTLAVS